MKILRNKNQGIFSASLKESYSLLMGNTDNREQVESHSNTNFEQFSLYEDSKYETHVSCSFDNVKL